jgi:hypothetical protein
VLGSILNYTLSGGDIKVKVHLEIGLRKLTVYSTHKTEGDIINDLPKDGMFFPAIQTKYHKFTKNARLIVQSNFEIQVPNEK